MQEKVFFQPFCTEPISLVHHNKNLNFPVHYHTAFEAVFVFSGTLKLITDIGTLNLGAGDIVLIPSLVIHGYSSSDLDCCTIVFQNETFLDVENYLAVNAKRQILILKEDKSDVLQLISEILGEAVYYQNTNDMAMSIAYGKILLMQLFRLSENALKRETESFDNLQIKHTGEILIFIQEHYRENLSLESMSKYLKLNKYMISKIINKNLGMSLSELVNKYRLLDVCRLLEFSDLPLSDIAEETGFSSESTLYRNFRKTFNMSPYEYRKGKLFQ